MAIISSAEALAQIPELTGTTEGTKLDTLIAGLGPAFASYCGWPAASATALPTMESASYTFYVTGEGGRDLLLPVRPITAVSSVYDDPTLDFTASTYLVSSSDYTLTWIPGTGQMLRLSSTATHGVWSTTPGAIRIVCTAGYATVPDGLKRIAEMAVRNWWDMRKTRGQAAPQGVAGAARGGRPPRREVDVWLPDHVREALAAGGFVLPSAISGGL